jgi:hypothetical protein
MTTIRADSIELKPLRPSVDLESLPLADKPNDNLGTIGLKTLKM